MIEDLDNRGQGCRLGSAAAVGRRRRLALHGALIAGLAVLLAAAAPASALEVAGVAFAPRRQADGTALELSGAGLSRYRKLVKAYAAALYTEPGLPAERILDDVPKRIEIEYFWSIPAEALRRVTRERIGLATAPDAFAELEPAIEAMNALYSDIEAGDRLSITYLPGRGTELALNDMPRGVVEGSDFARAMFGVWLGDSPVDERLRARMLADAR